MQMLLRDAEYLCGLGAFNLRSSKAPSHTAQTLAHRSILQAFNTCGLGRGQFRLGREAAALGPSV